MVERNTNLVETERLEKGFDGDHGIGYMAIRICGVRGSPTREELSDKARRITMEVREEMSVGQNLSELPHLNKLVQIVDRKSERIIFTIPSTGTGEETRTKRIELCRKFYTQLQEQTVELGNEDAAEFVGEEREKFETKIADWELDKDILSLRKRLGSNERLRAFAESQLVIHTLLGRAKKRGEPTEYRDKIRGSGQLTEIEKERLAAAFRIFTLTGMNLELEYFPGLLTATINQVKQFFDIKEWIATSDPFGVRILLEDWEAVLDLPRRKKRS